jgi:hypothetical protein
MSYRDYFSKKSKKPCRIYTSLAGFYHLSHLKMIYGGISMSRKAKKLLILGVIGFLLIQGIAHLFMNIKFVGPLKGHEDTVFRVIDEGHLEASLVILGFYWLLALIQYFFDKNKY